MISACDTQKNKCRTNWALSYEVGMWQTWPKVVHLIKLYNFKIAGLP